jgi:hypothetical protein
MKSRRPVPALIPFLVFVSLVFIGILIFAYVETKKANPQMIDVGQVGNLRPIGTRPRDACTRPHHGLTRVHCLPA